MCGRFLLATPADEIAHAFGVVGGLSMWTGPRYNIAPSQPILIVRARETDGREGALVRWGLIPSWSKDEGIGLRTINARSETAPEKPAFRDAFRKRRCIVPADGFYEWKKLGGEGKQPMLIRAAGGTPLGMAGLWESWPSPSGDTVESGTILTCAPNEMMSAIHDRMPVILDPAEYDEWLNSETTPERLRSLLDPCPSAGLSALPVSRRVNSPRHDDPACAEPVKEQGGLFGP